MLDSIVHTLSYWYFALSLVLVTTYLPTLLLWQEEWLTGTRFSQKWPDKTWLRRTYTIFLIVGIPISIFTTFMLTNGQETHLEIYYWVAVPLLLTNVLKGIIELVLGISPRLGLNFDTMFRLSIFEPEWKKYLLRFAVDPVAVRRIGKIRLALVFITAIIGLLLIL